MEKRLMLRNEVIYFVVFTTAEETIRKHLLRPAAQAVGMTAWWWNALWVLVLLAPFVLTLYAIDAGYRWSQWREAVKRQPRLWWNLGLTLCLTLMIAAGGWQYVQDPFRMAQLILAALALTMSTGWALAVIAAFLPASGETTETPGRGKGGEL